MTDIVVKVEKLSKQYRIGGKPEKYATIRDILTNGFKAPIRRVGQLMRGQPTGAAELDVEFWALKDISFEINRGEVVGIIGRNGAGKSTLLKILSRITEPTKGLIEIRGRVGSLLEVGTGFHPELTGRENIFLSGAILGMTKEEIGNNFDEIVAFSEIQKFVDTPVKHYSSGMYLRLAFAVAAYLESEILIVDEVLAVGDLQFQKKCLGKMEKVAKEGRTVLLVSHNMSAILNLCDRTILLNDGEIVSQGNPNDVVGEYYCFDQALNVFSPRCHQEVGGQKIRIEDFWVEPSPPETGSPIDFVFTLVRREPVPLDLDVDLAVSISTETGVRIFQVYSGHMGQRFKIAEGKVQIIGRIENLCLAPGNYLLNLWVGSGNTALHWLKECYVLVVKPGSFGQSAMVDNRGYPVLTSSSWFRNS